MDGRQKFGSEVPEVATDQLNARKLIRDFPYMSILEPGTLVSDAAACIRELVSSKLVLISIRSEVCVAEELALAGSDCFNRLCMPSWFNIVSLLL